MINFESLYRHKYETPLEDCIINAMPDDVLNRIFFYLGNCDAVTGKTVCNYWQQFQVQEVGEKKDYSGVGINDIATPCLRLVHEGNADRALEIVLLHKNRLGVCKNQLSERKGVLNQLKTLTNERINLIGQENALIQLKEIELSELGQCFGKRDHSKLDQCFTELKLIDKALDECEDEKNKCKDELAICEGVIFKIACALVDIGDNTKSLDIANKYSKSFKGSIYGVNAKDLLKRGEMEKGEELALMSPEDTLKDKSNAVQWIAEYFLYIGNLDKSYDLMNRREALVAKLDEDDIEHFFSASNRILGSICNAYADKGDIEKTTEIYNKILINSERVKGRWQKFYEEL